MSLSSKIQRLKEALASEDDPDLLKSGKAILSGMTFFKLGINSSLAKKRYQEHCSGCEYNVTDPVEDMRETDTQIPDASDKMCSHCGGCVLAYKLRQNVIKCEFWDE
mgnify:CR=1 FL=1